MKKLLLVAMVLLLIISVVIYSNYKQEETLINTFHSEATAAGLYYEESLQNNTFSYDDLNSIRIGKAGYCTIISSDMNVLHHPNGDIIGQQVPDILLTLIEAAQERFDSGENHLLSKYTFDGQDKILYLYKASDGTFLMTSEYLD